MRRRRIAAVAICGLVALLACGASTGPGQGGRTNGRIVFASREGDPQRERQQIYAMNPDGSNKVQLTQELADGYTILSARAGGTRVSFIKVNEGVFSGVFTMRGDGSELIGPFDFGFLGPISPDETRILGVRHQNGEDAIGIGDLLTGEARYLAVGDLLVLDVFWSPDGDWIGFTGRDDQTILSDLYLIRTDGSDLRRLTEDEAGELAPSWSPDGRRIVFSREILGQPPTLHTIDRDGSDLEQVAPLDCHGRPPVWSPDGSELLCTNIRGETVAIIHVASGESRSTGFPLGSCSGWSPDGTKLLCSDFHGVHTMSADGSDLSLIIPFDGGVPGAVWLRAEDE
jgi:Tol biopolymer transport system component